MFYQKRFYNFKEDKQKIQNMIKTYITIYDIEKNLNHKLIIKQAKQNISNLIQQNKKTIDNLKDILFDKEVLYFDEIL